jgi:hypothetical protein
MGTPTIITIKGCDNYGQIGTIDIYRSHDGDPVTTLRDLATVISRACDMANAKALDAPHIAGACIVTPSTLAGLYIGETTGTFGMAAHILAGRDSYAEYIYTVDIKAGTIECTDEDENPLDPFAYLDRLVDSAVDSHRAALNDAIAALDVCDFKVLPGEKAER